MKTFREFVAEQEDRAEKISTPEFEIPTINLEHLQEKINKLNKTAAKLNLKPVVLTISEPYAKKVYKPGLDDYEVDYMYLEYVKVKVEGEAPKLAGWTFVGKRSPLEGTESILTKSAPGMEMPAKYFKDTALKCDHCGRGGRRSDTFIVKKGRSHKEVGRTCLKDFLGHQDPAKYASYAEELYSAFAGFGSFEDQNYGGGGRKAVRMFNTANIIATALHEIKENGFISAKSAVAGAAAGGSITPTSTRVRDAVDPPPYIPSRNVSRSEWYDQFKITPTADDKIQAVDVVVWAKNHPRAGKEEFWSNLQKIVSAGKFTTLKHVGYLTAATNMFLIHIDQAKRHEVVTDSIKDSYVGEEGAKIDVKGTVLSIFSYESQSGFLKRVITVKTDEGHLIKMFTASEVKDVAKDGKVHITGRVGKNAIETYDRSPFKGMKMTTLAPRSRIAPIK